MPRTACYTACLQAKLRRHLPVYVYMMMNKVGTVIDGMNWIISDILLTENVITFLMFSPTKPGNKCVKVVKE